jgi:glycosyltransferase involved in cell wall biosynthesis
MKVLHVSFQDDGGGAAKGAYRLHTSMLSENVDSKLLVIRKKTKDPSVIQVPFIYKVINYIQRKLCKIILLLHKPEFPRYQSLNIFSSRIYKLINASDAEIVQFHWINENTVGIPDFKKINKPIVWKLADMWAFSGSEHYLPNSDRYINGYTKSNRTEGIKGIDISKFVWQQKFKYWKNINLTIVCPSKWLVECARSSLLFKNTQIINIPNPVDLNIFKPCKDRKLIRQKLKLPLDKKLILYSSILPATKDPRKGYIFLEQCLYSLTKHLDPSEVCIVFMGAESHEKEFHGIKTYNLHQQHDEYEIASIYSSVDVCAVPSVSDNLPNTIKESMACGTPCVAFDVGGVPDMIEHKINGYLVTPEDTLEFGIGLAWVLSQDKKTISSAARLSAYELHNPKSRVNDYINLYSDILSQK